VKGYALANAISANVLDTVRIPRFQATLATHTELADIARNASQGRAIEEERLDLLAVSVF
jgi:hypothetical protein